MLGLVCGVGCTVYRLGFPLCVLFFLEFIGLGLMKGRLVCFIHSGGFARGGGF